MGRQAIERTCLGKAVLRLSQSRRLHDQRVVYAQKRAESCEGFDPGDRSIDALTLKKEEVDELF